MYFKLIFFTCLRLKEINMFDGTYNEFYLNILNVDFGMSVVPQEAYPQPNVVVVISSATPCITPRAV